MGWIVSVIPLVHNITKSRMQILGLFFDVPTHHVVELADKCENFLTNHTEERLDEVDTHDDSSVASYSNDTKGGKG